jgi:filamentous hemagglutinin
VTTPEHPLWSWSAGGYTNADRIERGDWLFTHDAGWAHVESVSYTGRTETVYNLTVEGAESYFVGEAGVLAHNNPACLVTGAAPAANSTRLGVPRTNTADWRQLRDLWDRTGDGEILSEANRSAIAKGRTPVVDDAWIEYFPGDKALRGEKIPMHHIGGLPITVPLPASRHLDAHMPGGFRINPGGPGTSG